MKLLLIMLSLILGSTLKAATVVEAGENFIRADITDDEAASIYRQLRAEEHRNNGGFREIRAYKVYSNKNNSLNLYCGFTGDQSIVFYTRIDKSVSPELVLENESMVQLKVTGEDRSELLNALPKSGVLISEDKKLQIVCDGQDAQCLVTILKPSEK